MPTRPGRIHWLIIVMLAVGLPTSLRAAQDWASEAALGDVVVSFDEAVRVYGNSNGVQKGADIPVAGSNRGLAFDGALTLLVTNTSTSSTPPGRVVRLSPEGSHGETGTQATQANPQSIVFAGNGEYFVAARSSASQVVIRRFAANGTHLEPDWTVPVASNGTCVGIDLDANQQTLYIVDGAANPQPRLIRTLNVSTGAQGALGTALTGSGRAACGIRALPPVGGSNLTNGGFLVADRIDIRRLSPTGALVGTAFTTGTPSPSDNNWIDVDLDPNTFDFWGLDAGERRVARFRIGSPPNALQSIGFLDVPRGLTLNGALRAGETIRLLELTANTEKVTTPGFLQGTPYVHTFQIKPEGSATALLSVQAVEATSDGNPAGATPDGNGICPASLDLDCRLKERFPHTVDASLSAAKARRYSRNRAVFYMATELQPGCSSTSSSGCLPPSIPLRVGVVFEDPSPGSGAACVPLGATQPAVALLRDPKPHTAPSQVGYSIFEEDITFLVFSDEIGAMGRTLNHYVVADRSDTRYSSRMVKPTAGTDQQLGSTLQVSVEIRDPMNGCSPVPGLSDQELALSITDLVQKKLIIDSEGVSPDGVLVSGLTFVSSAAQYRANITLSSPIFVGNATQAGVPSHRVCVNAKADPDNPTAPRAIGEVCQDFRVSAGKGKK